MTRTILMTAIILLGGCTTMDGYGPYGTTADGMPLVMQAPKCRMGTALVCKTSPRTVQQLAADCECAYMPTSFTNRQIFSSARLRR